MRTRGREGGRGNYLRTILRQFRLNMLDMHLIHYLHVILCLLVSINLSTLRQIFTTQHAKYLFKRDFSCCQLVVSYTKTINICFWGPLWWEIKCLWCSP